MKDKSFIFPPEVWAKSFGTSDGIVEAVHSELHSTYPDRNFGGFCLSGNKILYFYLVVRQKKFVNCVKKVSSLLKTALYPCRSLSSTFSSNVLWILKVSDFGRNFFGLIAKTFSYRSRFLLEQKRFTEKNINCHCFVHFGQKIFTHRTKSVLAVFSIMPCTCPGQYFGWKFYLEKNGFLYFLWPWVTKFQTFSSIFFSMLLMMVILRVQKRKKKETKMRKTTVLYFLRIFWAENLCTLAKIVEAVFSKLCFTFPEKSFRGKCFQKILLSCFYAFFERKDFVLWVKIFCMFLKTVSYVYRSIQVVFFVSYCELKGYQNLINFVWFDWQKHHSTSPEF